jgi:hypothetical protein
MCDELKQMEMGDILACYAISKEGTLLGASYGEWLPKDEELKADFSRIVSVVWGGLDRATTIGGPLEKAEITYGNFKLVGFPVVGTNMALLLTVEVKFDSEILRSRVHNFVAYWLKVNHWVE